MHWKIGLITAALTIAADSRERTRVNLSNGDSSVRTPGPCSPHRRMATQSAPRRASTSVHSAPLVETRTPG